MYNDLVLYYFSGTGNALTAARWIARSAASKGINTSLISIDRFKKPSFPSHGKKTLIGFLYPTHGFSLPWIMLKFMLMLPLSARQDAFLLNTRAGMKAGRWFTPGLSGMAQLLAMFVLKIKGFNIKGLLPLDMPSNWISIHPGLNKKTVDSIFIRCRGITENFSEKILTGKRIYKGLFSLPIDIAIIPVAIGYSIFARFILAKSFISSSDCGSCRLCEEVCPTEALKITNGRPYWSFKCESCMRCMNICPTKSIQTAHSFVILTFIILSFIPYSLWLTATISKYLAGSSILAFNILYKAAGWSFQMLFIFITYHILHFIIKNRSINNFFTYTSLTRYWRRYRSPEVKTSDFRQKK
jgi:ferredoxin